MHKKWLNSDNKCNTAVGLGLGATFIGFPFIGWKLCLLYDITVQGEQEQLLTDPM